MGIAVAAVVATVSLACSDKPLPGTMLGRFGVVGKVRANSCGSSLGAPDPWTFDVELSRSGSTLYWSFMDGRATVTGDLNAASEAKLAYAVAANVDGTDAGGGACTMQRGDAIDVTFPTATTPTSFAGSFGSAFSAATGADCTDQLASGGGMYATLPCTVTYDISGTRK